MSNTASSYKKIKNSFQIIIITWFLCSIPSFVMIAYLFIIGRAINCNSFLGIEANEILVYIMSFVGCIIAYYFAPLDNPNKFRVASAKIICFISIITLIGCIVAFLFLKMELSPDKNKLLYKIIFYSYWGVILLWFWHTWVSSPPDIESIDKKQSQDLANLDSKFTSKLNKKT